jgi:hypothetical protein
MPAEISHSAKFNKVVLNSSDPGVESRIIRATRTLISGWKFQVVMLLASGAMPQDTNVDRD